jgi:hypothetical protein
MWNRCRTSKEIVAEYALGGFSNQVFASNYVYYIPGKEQLVNEVKYSPVKNISLAHPTAFGYTMDIQM